MHPSIHPSIHPQMATIKTIIQHYSCPEGKERLFSESMVHTIHWYIFILAMMHILYCTLMHLWVKTKLR